MKEKPKKQNKKDIDRTEDTAYDNDVVFEEEAHGEEVVKKFRDKLKVCKEERQEYLDGWQRAKADFVNAKNEEQTRRAEYFVVAKEEILTELLTVLDSFDMAFANKDAWESVDENWRRGVEHIHAQLIRVLENNGTEEINPINKKFDPRVHTSIDTIETDDKDKDHMVVEVTQKGYLLRGDVVRSPKVKVAIYKKKEK